MWYNTEYSRNAINAQENSQHFTRISKENAQIVVMKVNLKHF